MTRRAYSGYQNDDYCYKDLHSTKVLDLIDYELRQLEESNLE